MNDTRALDTLIKDYKYAANALAELMLEDDTADGFGARFVAALAYCREVRQQLECAGQQEHEIDVFDWR